MAQEIADSKLLDTWGSGGTKIEPDISKIIEGWQLGEQPPHEYMNWLQNTFGSKLNHILKNGVAKWDSETEYLAGSSVQHNGNVWLGKTTNTNSEPTGLNANWEKVAINKDLTVTVDTLADLRSISYPANTVWASGYHAKNDGAFGSHIFRLKGVKTTETDNGGTVIVATIGGVDYVYELQFNGAVNVKWFGAKGDGVTDNRDVILSLINTVVDKTILLTDGVFMSSRLGFFNRHNVTIELSNATLQIIDDLTETLEPFIKFLNGSSNCHIKMDSNSYIKRNKIDYTTSEHRHCISFLDCSNCSVSGGNIIDSGGDGIYLAAIGESGLPKNIKIQNTKIDNNKRQGISIISGTNISIDNVEITNTSGTGPSAGIDIEPEDGYYVYDVHINNVRCINNDGSGLLINPKLGSVTHTMNINVNGFYSEGGIHGVAIGRSLDRLSPMNVSINGLQVNNASIQAIKLYDIGSNNNINIVGQTYDNGVPALAHYADNTNSEMILLGTPNINVDLSCGGSGTLMYTINTSESALMSKGTNIIFRDNLKLRTVSLVNSFVGKIKTFKDNPYTIVTDTTLRAVHTAQGTRVPNNFGSTYTCTYTLDTTYPEGSVVTIEVRGNHPIILSANSGLIYPFGTTSITASQKYSRITLENIGSNNWRAVGIVGNWS